MTEQALSSLGNLWAVVDEDEGTLVTDSMRDTDILVEQEFGGENRQKVILIGMKKSRQRPTLI